MKRNLFPRLCLMMVIILSFHSCRQDVFPEQKTYNNSSAFQLTSRRISLNEAKHKAKLLPELEKAETELKKFKNNVHGKVISYGNGVSIDTDNVTFIENGPNFHTYTFNLTRENALPTDPVENLVLTPLTDGTYKELLVTYNFTPQEKQVLMNGGFVDTEGKANITELATGTYNNNGLMNKSWSCGWGYQLEYTVCSENMHSHGELSTVEGGTCSATTTSVAVLVAVYRCYDINDPNDLGNDWWAGPGSGGGGGGGNPPCTDCPPSEENPPAGPCNGNGVATGPLDPNTNIGEGGCAGVVTTPTLEFNPPQTPCEKIKAKFADTRFKEKVNAIDKPEVFDYDHEMGYAAGYPPANTGVTGTQYPPMENTLGTHNVKLPDGDQYFGFIHSHNNESNGGYPVKIFSPADLGTFLTSCVLYADQHGSIGDAYTMVITSEGNYMLQFTGNSSGFGIGPNTIKFWKLWYGRESKAIQNEDGTIDQNKVEQLFLRFLKEKVKIDGIELYNIEKTIGKAKKLTLDNNNNVIPTPCP